MITFDEAFELFDTKVPFPTSWGVIKAEIERLKAENEKLKTEREAKLEKAFDHNEEECKRCMEKVEARHCIALSLTEDCIRNKTAKEILQTLLECSEMVEIDGQEFPFIYTENIFSLAKEYGVGVGV